MSKKARNNRALLILLLSIAREEASAFRTRVGGYKNQLSASWVYEGICAEVGA